jgi:hypothetical protein
LDVPTEPDEPAVLVMQKQLQLVPIHSSTLSAGGGTIANLPDIIQWHPGLHIQFKKQEVGQ